MPKPRRLAGATGKVRIADPPRHSLPLPRERLAAQPFVWNGDTGRLVAPWRRGTPLTIEEQQQLVAVLDRVETMKPGGVVWLWPDPTRQPVPVTADNAAQWADRWAADRAVYVSR